MSPGSTTTYVRVGARRLRVCSEGEGPALVLCNGLMAGIDHWGGFRAAVGGLRLITFDAPGVGGSAMAAMRVSISQLSDNVIAVLDALELDKTHVLGYSHGGAVAQQVALDAPDRIDRLVLIATHCGVGAVPPEPPALLASLVGHWSRGLAAPLILPATLWGQLGAIGSWSSIPGLGRIRAPTLVISGGEDRLVPPANARLLARRIPQAELRILPGEDHALVVGPAHRRVGRLVTDFLERSASGESVDLAG